MYTDRMFKELADLGICASGQRLWRKSNRDVEMIIKVWKKWPEYWVEHSEKVLDIVRRYFSSEDDLRKLEGHCIFLDREMNITIGSEESVFVVGSSSGSIHIKDWATAKIYCFNHADLRISCGFHSYVNIECYDQSMLTVGNNKGKCTIYAYDDSTIESGDSKANVVCKSVCRGEVFNGEEIEP